MTVSMLTRGQVERTLSQRIQALYREQLEHRPGKVTCQLFDEKVAIIIEDSITQPEQLLAQEGHRGLAKEVRSGLDSALQPQLKMLIEDVLGVAVIDLLSDATLETGRTGMIVVLAGAPTVRTSVSAPKQRDKLSSGKPLDTSLDGLSSGQFESSEQLEPSGKPE